MTAADEQHVKVSYDQGDVLLDKKEGKVDNILKRVRNNPGY